MPQEDKYNWVKVAASVAEIPFGENALVEVDADGKTVCLGFTGEEIVAFAPKCPHASGRFVDGRMDAAGNVVCPLHRYKFCPKNGRNITGEGYYLKHWPVAIRDEGIFVGLDKGLFANLL